MDENVRKKIVDDYEKRSNEILKKMYSVIVRMHRKKDDANYKKLIEKL